MGRSRAMFVSYIPVAEYFAGGWSINKLEVCVPTNWLKTMSVS